MAEVSETGELPIINETSQERKFSLSSMQYQSIELGRGESIDLSATNSVLSEADVISQIGINLGELVAQVQLPYKEGLNITEPGRLKRTEPNLLYCFKQINEGRHSTSDVPTYVIVGAEQLSAMMNGTEVPDDQYLILDEPGQKKDIGREKWMPGVGDSLQHDAEKRNAVYGRSPAVSRNQGSFSITEQGHLRFTVSEAAKNENVVKVGRGFAGDEEKELRLRRLRGW